MHQATLRAFVDEMQGTLMKEAFISKLANIPPPAAGTAPGFGSRAANWIGRHKEHLTHGAELAGLGILGVPSAQKLRKIRSAETSPEEKRTAKYELAGLGVLAAPSAIHLGHAAWKHFRG